MLVIVGMRGRKRNGDEKSEWVVPNDVTRWELEKGEHLSSNKEKIMDKLWTPKREKNFM